MHLCGQPQAVIFRHVDVAQQHVGRLARHHVQGLDGTSDVFEDQRSCRYDDDGHVSAVFRLVSCDLGGNCAATHIYSTVECGAFGDDDVIGREVTVHRR